MADRFIVDDDALMSDAKTHRTVMQGLIEQSRAMIEQEIRGRALWAQSHGKRLAITGPSFGEEGTDRFGRPLDPTAPWRFNVKYHSLVLRPGEPVPIGFTVIEVHE